MSQKQEKRKRKAEREAKQEATPQPNTSGFAYRHAMDLQEAFMSIGTSMIKPDFACKLLAYVLVMGGGNEAAVMNPLMNAGIGMAAQLLNIKGGCVPNAELLPELQKRIRELEDNMENTEWLPEIGDRYNLKIAYGTYGTPSNPINDKMRHTKRRNGAPQSIDLTLLLQILNNQ
jgi:hypothetical protein